MILPSFRNGTGRCIGSLVPGLWIGSGAYCVAEARRIRSVVLKPLRWKTSELNTTRLPVGTTAGTAGVQVFRPRPAGAGKSEGRSATGRRKI